LKLVSHREAETGDCACKKSPPVHASEVASVEESQADEGEDHAHQVEEKRRDVGEGIFHDHKRAAPDGDHGNEQHVRAQRTRSPRLGVGHAARLANDRERGARVISVMTARAREPVLASWCSALRAILGQTITEDYRGMLTSAIDLALFPSYSQAASFPL
jgi:hypothetical protein